MQVFRQFFQLKDVKGNMLKLYNAIKNNNNIGKLSPINAIYFNTKSEYENYLKYKLMDIQDTSKECNGYVVFEKRGINISYYPYIRCANYKTQGYDSLKEEN